MFSGFPTNLKAIEKKSAKKYVKKSDFKGIDPKKLSKLAEKILAKNKHELIKGNITNTSKNYVKKNYGFKISLLHLDLDLLLHQQDLMDLNHITIPNHLAFHQRLYPQDMDEYLLQILINYYVLRPLQDFHYN